MAFTDDKRLSLGFSYMPFSAVRAAEAAQAAEQAGFDIFGLPDSQVLWSGLYSTLALCATRTSTLRMGPHVTNPITRHPTVTAAELRALEEFAPARIVLGIATGDGAVYGIGRKAAKASTLEQAIVAIRESSRPDLRVQVAAGGPRIAAVAGATGSEVILGTGTSRPAIEQLRSSMREAARGEPTEPWLLMIFNLSAEHDMLEAARDEVRASVMAYTRHSLATRPDSTELPADLDRELREVLGRYDFHEHARPGDSPNARLAASLSSELAERLERRYAVIGTPEAAAERLMEISEETGIRRFWLACNVGHPERVLRVAEKMTARLQLRDSGEVRG